MVADGIDIDSLAVALAPAFGRHIAYSAHPACAYSYYFNSKTAHTPTRPHPPALAAPVELALDGTASSPAIPFVSMRQSRHSQLR